jgi:hypothetical protein
MPRTATATGVVDFILPPPKIAAELAVLARHPAYKKREESIPLGDESPLDAYIEKITGSS